MIEDIEKPHRSIANLLDKIIAKYDSETTAELSRDEVIRLTAKMKRENFRPMRSGCPAVREFLEAGFLDCAYADLKRMGLNSETVTLWAKRQPDIVVHELDGNSFNHTVVYNLAKNADRGKVKKYEKARPRKNKTKTSNTRSCYDQRLARKVASRSKRQGTVDE